MHEIVNIVAPVFGLILIGWLAAKSGYVSAGSGRVVAEFAFKIAMPALLFRSMLSVGEMPGSPLMLVAAYFLSAALVWITAAALTLAVLRRPAPDAASIAMGSTFSNSVMLGVPLALSAFGPEAAAPAALLISLDTPALWIAATLHHAFAARTTDGPVLPRLGGVVLDLAKNPIILALLAGIVGRANGLVVPELPDRLLALLHQAAVPSALCALGMSLATYEIKGQAPTLAVICILKLVAYPLVAYVMCVHVFALPPLWSAVAVLFAAMPVGANAYLFAQRYERAVGSVSSAIAVSTTIAVLSVAGVLYVLKGWVG